MSEPIANYEVQPETNRDVASRSMMEQLTEEAIQQIEEEQALQRKSAVSVFRSMLNQPALVSISSANATSTGINESFNEFSVNLPRPILKVKSVQLLNANIPECTQNIPNTACAFWYYRLDAFNGSVPNPQNLYMARLLPSYYKPEFFDANSYGYNRTFFGYDEVADELVKSGQVDIAYDNLVTLEQAGDFVGQEPYYPSMPFLPNDVEITFDPILNKFQMTGMNAYLPLVWADDPDISSIGNIAWSGSTTYALGAFATYNDKIYRSLQAGNLNHTPPTFPTKRNAWWAFVMGDEGYVRSYVSTYPYSVGSIVYYVRAGEGNWWRNKRASVGGIPNLGSLNWELFPLPIDNIYKRYLIAGYDDPNVAIRQGTQKLTWNPYNRFFGLIWNQASAIEYNGAYYLPGMQSDMWNVVPFQYLTTWSSANYYVVNDLVVSGGVYYLAIQSSVNQNPATQSLFWRTINPFYSSSVNYNVGDIVVNAGATRSFICIQANIGQALPTATPFINTYWQTNYWTRDFTVGAGAAPAGLNAISAEYDMLDTYPVVNNFVWPFPAAIPGQPFNPTPKRLLNSILGFTWNGVMNPTSLETFVDFPVAGNTTLVQLYNRLRPVPPYVTSGSLSTGLTSTTAMTTQTFTANGYANLVYSSVVAIYGSVAGARTLDTQRNTSLLGMTSMNADNLGVSFYGNYIESELIANGEDLYSISIQLYDEFNEPFVLTNNAVVTLTFKMTYENK
jgi:hypothetical protein